MDALDATNPFDSWLDGGCRGCARGGDTRPTDSPFGALLPAASTQTVIVDGITIAGPDFTEGIGGRWPDITLPDLPGPPGVDLPIPAAPCLARFELPPLTETAWFTQACFLESDVTSAANPQWPPTTCPAPCVTPRRGCPLPSPWSLERARNRFKIVVPPESWFGDDFEGDGVVGSEALVAPLVLTETLAPFFGPEVANIYELLTAALALMMENADIVEWVVCLVDDWSALVPERWVPGGQPNGFAYNTGQILPCFLDGFEGEFALYLLDNYGLGRVPADAPLPPRTWQGTVADWYQSLRTPITATGSATEEDRRFPFVDALVANGWPLGLIIPVAGPGGNHLQSMHARYAQGGANALCALVAMAEILVHELLHICVEGEIEPSQCWQLQHMAANTFQWAMGERFPCLRGATCCHRIDPFYVMNPGPVLPPGLAIAPPFDCFYTGP